MFFAFAAWNMEQHVLCFCSMEYGTTCSVLLQHGIWNNMFCVFLRMLSPVLGRFRSDVIHSGRLRIMSPNLPALAF
jgi:hypothetical protein